MVDEVATDVLPGLVAVRQQLDPAKLRPAGDRIDLAPLAAAAPELQRLRLRTTAIESEAAGLPTSGVPGVLARRASPTCSRRSPRPAPRWTPPIWPPGCCRRCSARTARARTCWCCRSNDEARGTGGLVGGYGVLTASRGKVAVVTIGPNNDLRSLSPPALDLGPDYTALYGADPALWPNVNLSPHFPYAGALMLAMWRGSSGSGWTA